MEEDRRIGGYSEEEISSLIEGHKEFIEQLSEKMSGKTTEEILPMDISMIVSICLARLFSHTPSSVMMKSDLMNMATLIANSVLKFQEQKGKEAQALDKLWKE